MVEPTGTGRAFWFCAGFTHGSKGPPIRAEGRKWTGHERQSGTRSGSTRGKISMARIPHYLASFLRLINGFLFLFFHPKNMKWLCNVRSCFVANTKWERMKLNLVTICRSVAIGYLLASHWTWKSKVHPTISNVYQRVNIIELFNWNGNEQVRVESDCIIFSFIFRSHTTRDDLLL